MNYGCSSKGKQQAFLLSQQVSSCKPKSRITLFCFRNEKFSYSFCHRFLSFLRCVWLLFGATIDEWNRANYSTFLRRHTMRPFFDCYPSGNGRHSNRHYKSWFKQGQCCRDWRFFSKQHLSNSSKVIVRVSFERTNPKNQKLTFFIRLVHEELLFRSRLLTLGRVSLEDILFAHTIPSLFTTPLRKLMCYPKVRWLVERTAVTAVLGSKSSTMEVST